MPAIEFRLLNDFQRRFPLVPEPYAVLAETLGVAEQQVLDRLARLREAGAVSRVGAVFRPGAIGASTLAAMAVPPGRLDAVAAVVSRFPEVNHNYERDHRYNLWFVAAAPDDDALEALLGRVERATGIAVLALPLLEEYHIDLGFRLDGAGERAARAPRAPERAILDAADRRLVAALEDGLPLLARPYAAVAARAGLDERAAAEGVTLAYRRARYLPEWPYNLYCMLHGVDRALVWERIDTLSRGLRLEGFPRAVLFSRTRFKQTGARVASLGAMHG
jgi:DNA-binding Lrp family transcriptional regulator